MLSNAGVNERILKEVDKLDQPKEIKALLKDLLAIELRGYDQQVPRYGEAFREAFRKHIGI